MPARARRPLHRAGRLGHPGRPARRGPALGLRVQLGQPGGAGRRAAGRLDRRPAGAVHDGGGARDAGRPQGRAPRPPRRAGRAARDRAGARGRHVVHRRRAVALLQHQQPVDRPARAAGAAGRRPGRAVAAADRQPEDRRPPGQGEHAGDPAGDGDGRGRRLDPGRAGRAGSAHPLRPGQDHQRPARRVVRRLRADGGRADEPDVRRLRSGGDAGRRPLQAGPRLRAAVPRRAPRRCAAAAGCRSTATSRSGRRRGRGRRAGERATAVADGEVLRG